MNRQTMIQDFQKEIPAIWANFQSWLKLRKISNPTYNTLFTWLHYNGEGLHPLNELSNPEKIEIATEQIWGVKDKI